MPVLPEIVTLEVQCAGLEMPDAVEAVPTPLIVMLRSVTTSLTPALTVIPLTPPELRTLAMTPVPSIVIPLVIVTEPKPPESSALISPPGAVLEIAPANVLHGAVRLQGFTSSPTPETHVRGACANADELARTRATRASAEWRKRRGIFIDSLSVSRS
jgi:hypothetical protein